MNIQVPDTFTMVNGELQGLPLAQDRGFLYGEGLFETMRCQSGRVPLYDYHQARLERDCARIGFNFSADAARESLDAALAHMPADIDQWRIRLSVTQEQYSGGSYPQMTSPLRYTLQSTPLVHSAPHPLPLLKAKAPLPDMPQVSGIKLISRVHYIVACQGLERLPGDEVYFCDARGNVVETMHHNIVLLREGVLLTPRLTTSGVAGVMREVLMTRLSKEVGLTVTACDLTPADLVSGDELLLCNALQGFTAVARVNQAAVTNIGLFHKLNRCLYDMFGFGNAEHPR